MTIEVKGVELEISPGLEIKGVELEISRGLEIKGIEIEIQPSFILCDCSGGGGGGGLLTNPGMTGGMRG